MVTRLSSLAYQLLGPSRPAANPERTLLRSARARALSAVDTCGRRDRSSACAGSARRTAHQHRRASVRPAARSNVQSLWAAAGPAPHECDCRWLRYRSAAFQNEADHQAHRAHGGQSAPPQTDRGGRGLKVACDLSRPRAFRRFQHDTQPQHMPPFSGSSAKPGLQLRALFRLQPNFDCIRYHPGVES